jgi:tetratricopeptide (TPR) repeat protein
LANARRLALDHLAAEQGFLIAEAEWSLAEKRDPLVEAEFLFYKATLRWFQRSHGEALRLVTRGIDLSRRLGVPVLLARSLILRAGVRKNVGDLPATIPDLREALELINEHDHLYLSCVAYTHLATSHIRLEDYEEAAKVVSQARELCRELEYEIGWYQVLWLDGLVQQGLGQYLPAERFLEEAHQGFIKLRERGYAAVIALDRGMLCHKQGRHSDVLALASQAIPILESFKIRREVLAALKLLRAALEKQEVTMALLQQVRDCLDDLLRDSATWSVLRQN